MKFKGIMVFAIAGTITSSSLKAQSNNEWPAYGGDAGGMRYSPSRQVNDQNVKQFKLAWTYQTGELKTYSGTKAKEKAAFEATPLMIDGTLYLTTPPRPVIAVDAVS